MLAFFERLEALGVAQKGCVDTESSDGGAGPEASDDRAATPKGQVATAPGATGALGCSGSVSTDSTECSTAERSRMAPEPAAWTTEQSAWSRVQCMEWGYDSSTGTGGGGMQRGLSDVFGGDTF
jgi:hypothetical protein